MQEDSSATDENEALSCNEFTPVSVITPQNRMPLSTLTMACERFHVSDKIGAAIASAVLVDYGLITSDQRRNVIDKNKLKAEITKFRKKLRWKRNFSLNR